MREDMADMAAKRTPIGGHGAAAKSAVRCQPPAIRLQDFGHAAQQTPRRPLAKQHLAIATPIHKGHTDTFGFVSQAP